MAAYGLYTHIASNKFKSILLLIGLFVLIYVLVFAGALDRYFRAYDDKTGKILWQMRASNIVNSFPITYSVKGRQYVAVAVGNGSSHARSLATLTPEIAVPDGGSALFVYALPARAPLLPQLAPPKPTLVFFEYPSAAASLTVDRMSTRVNTVPTSLDFMFRLPRTAPALPNMLLRPPIRAPSLSLLAITISGLSR